NSAVFEVCEIRSNRIGDERALLPSDDREPLLERRQPVDQVTRHSLILEAAGGYDEVFVRPPALECRLRVYGRVVALGEPGCGIEIVGTEILDDAHICDPLWEWALTSRGDLVNVPQVPVFDSSAKALEGGVIALDVADGAD